jgi:hypothetical protein
MDLWDINNGGIHVDLAIPVAIPSFNREAQLVDQTLNTLSFYGWNLSLVHIFVHPSHIRDNGISEGSAYRRHLRASGYGEVKLHRGGANLMKQCLHFCLFRRAKSGYLIRHCARHHLVTAPNQFDNTATAFGVVA